MVRLGLKGDVGRAGTRVATGHAGFVPEKQGPIDGERVVPSVDIRIHHLELFHRAHITNFDCLSDLRVARPDEHASGLTGEKNECLCAHCLPPRPHGAGGCRRAPHRPCSATPELG